MYADGEREREREREIEKEKQKEKQKDNEKEQQKHSVCVCVPCARRLWDETTGRPGENRHIPLQTRRPKKLSLKCEASRTGRGHTWIVFAIRHTRLGFVP